MMNSKKIIFILFGLILLAVPLFVMFGSEDILKNGNRHKIQLRGYDPFDPFRGKFIQLNYSINPVCDTTLKQGDECFVTLERDDSTGFSRFSQVLKEQPDHNDYFISKVEYGWGSSCSFSTNNFSKYFINEDKADRAEDFVIAYQQSRPDDIYVAIRVLDGEVRLEDIFIEETPLLEFLEKEENAAQNH